MICTTAFSGDQKHAKCEKDLVCRIHINTSIIDSSRGNLPSSAPILKVNMEINDILTEFETSARPKQKFQSLNLNEQLVQAMINERMAPELLPYKHDLMATVLQEIQSQQQFLLDSHEYGDSNAESGVVSPDFKLQLMIIETDLERVSYLVRLYIRTRLSKLDSFTIFYSNDISQESQRNLGLSRLSDQEKIYLQKHTQILSQLYNRSFLKKLPSFLTYLDDTNGAESMVTEPDLDSPVFIRVLSDSPLYVNLGAEGDLELVKDGIYVVRYRLIQSYVQIGDIILI